MVIIQRHREANTDENMKKHFDLPLVGMETSTEISLKPRNRLTIQSSDFTTGYTQKT